MKRNILISIVMLLFSLSNLVYAQTGGNYDLAWSTIDGGGGASSGSSYTLSGTIGQPDAGGMSGGSYILIGGFWAGAGPGGPPPEARSVYLPVILRE